MRGVNQAYILRAIGAYSCLAKRTQAEGNIGAIAYGELMPDGNFGPGGAVSIDFSLTWPL